MKNLFLSILVLSYSSILFSKCSGFEDDRRIKHLNLSNQEDFYYCFGYLHGLDRAWQILYFRHVAHGELAEILGYSFVRQDFQMRLLNLYELSIKIKHQMTDEMLKDFQNYTTGINDGIRKHLNNPSPEFSEVKVNRALWRVEDSLMLMLLQSFDQTRKTFVSDIEEELAKTKFKDKSISLLTPDFLPWDTTVLKAGEYKKSGSLLNKQTHLQKPTQFWPAIFGEEAGSNNWVIEKSKTKNNFAILANDPHLDLKTPMFWYWANFTTPEFDVIGASFPGVPIIVSGTNRFISWGLTNSYIKTAKAYVINEKEESELKSMRPWVWFKFGFLKIPIFFKSFYRLKNGDPVIPLDTIEKKMALHWSGFRVKANDLLGLTHVMKAKNVEEMDEALKQVGVPSWNFVFADIKGDIGHRVVGKAFRTLDAAPFGIDRMDKMSFLSPEEMPHVLKPKRNYIVTANNRHWPVDSVFHGGRGYSPGFRALRIESLINTHPEKISVNYVHQMQIDNQSVDAFFFRDEIYNIFKLDASLSPWGDKLIRWNLHTNLSCEMCFFYRRLMDLTMEKMQTNEAAIYRLLREKNAELSATIKEIAHEITKKPIPKWGEIHQIKFPHFSQDEDLAFSPRVPTAGDKHSVNPGSMKWEDETYFHTAGASQRLIVEMKPTPEIYLTLPGLNARYWDKGKLNPWQEWADGKLISVLYPVDWKVQKVEEF